MAEDTRRLPVKRAKAVEEKDPVRLPPPHPPIPPGEHPPPSTNLEHKAYREAMAEWQRYQASLFKLEDLQVILRSASAPELKDTFNTQSILRSLSGAVYSVRLADERPPPFLIQERIKKRRAALRKAWKSVDKDLTEFAGLQRKAVEWFAERPWYGADAKKFRENMLSSVEDVLQAMANLERQMFLVPDKAKGSHGSMGLNHLNVALEIFTRMPYAWEEADVSVKVSAAKRYLIIQKCLKEIGENVSVDAVKKAVSKYLRAYPYLVEKQGKS